MKILYPDKVTNVSASSEDTAFHKDNVSDDYRGHYWQATSAVDSTLTIEAAANSNVVALSNTNSTSVTVEVKDSGASTIYGPTVHTIDSEKPDLWVDYTLQTGISQTILTFTTTATAPYCGAVRIGSAYEFPNPEYGFSEGLDDKSIEKVLNSGAMYYNKKNIIRTFVGSMDANRDAYFYTFMHTIIMQFGKRPMFWRFTDLDNMDWVVFARITKMPSGSHDSFSHSKVSFALAEDILGVS